MCLTSVMSQEDFLSDASRGKVRDAAGGLKVLMVEFVKEKSNKCL